MKNLEERAKYNNYEMQDEYSFSGGIRGRFYKPKKYQLQRGWTMILFFF
jgi:hypothetical protein